MAVVARMFVQEISLFAYNPQAKTVKLQVVSRGEENKEWSAATPSGSVTLVINNTAAAEQFELGQDYLITFEKADKA